MKEIIEQLLNVKTRKEIADELNITIDSLKYKMKKYNIKRIKKKFDYFCINCCNYKTKNDFYRTSNSHLCKKCFNKRVLEKQREIKRLAVEYKGSSCQYCGYNKCLGALQFHHIEGKDLNWNYYKLRTFNDDFKKELDKCVLLCANCHAEEHTKYCIN